MDTHADPTQPPAGSIVVGLDGSPSSTGALSWAVHQAGLEQRPLTLVNSVEPEGYVGSGGLDATAGVDYGSLMDERRAAATTLMAQATALAAHQNPELSVHQVLTYADPRRTLLDLGETAAMIVVGSRGRGPVSSLLLGSVSVSVAKHAPCPVIVHRPIPAAATNLGILLGVDGTAYSLPATEFAFQMAAWRSLRLTVLHCSSEAPPVAPLVDGSPLPAPGAEQALVAESLAGMREKFPDVDAEVRFVRGLADQQLIAASYRYDLVVIGHHPLPALSDLLASSVAPTVVEHAHGAVAVVPFLEAAE